jgi:Haem-binding domain
MKKVLSLAFKIVLIGFVVIQFFRPTKNLAANNTAFAKDISTIYPMPDSVKAILQKACYDCHSNNTSYPWYANIQPVAWWLNHHVEEGKDEINFSTFASYSLRRQYRKTEEIINEVKDKEMPLPSYTIVHTNAKLSQAEIASVTNWAQSIRDTLQARYPLDSLVKKKA